MSKVLMEILGLSTSPSSGGAYALILNEAEGNQRLPIIIGSFEAQAIALELENIKPPRPMTHDLLKNFVLSFDTQIKEVYINDLSEGTFYAQIIYERENQLIELDARPSDAIALAVRFNAPIYVNEEVLNEAGISTEPEHQTLEEALKGDETSPGQKELSELEKLEAELKTAIETENYEKAAKIRDRISKMKG
ncbi:MAG TPA: bifunctional nuclease family protein [Gracilimonas sp.]|uniref:bifunctional nuclease family protein n=1 Tax=Gracilimonas sp. TaxID=1974203 RepID=UPI002DA669CD|nr:bifunctional nuclease family protein [Gracilimonas sp.]